MVSGLMGTRMVEARTLRSVREAGDDIRTLALVQISTIALIALVGLAAMVLLTRVPCARSPG